MSALSDKILSYTPEVYRPFNDTTISTGAAKFGTLTGDTITLSGSIGQYSYVADGPVGGDQVSWSLSKTTGLTDTRINHNNTNTIAAFTDKDYTIGFWVKYGFFPNNNSATANVLVSVGGTTATGSGFILNVYGSTASVGTQRKLQLSTGNGTAIVSTVATDQFPDDGEWHYIAVRRVLSDIKVYLDGSLVITGTNPNTGSASAIGYGGVGAFPQANFTMQLSNSHISSSSAIDETAIEEIWFVGSTGGAVDITITETPATALATQTEPTIAVTAGDHTEITTSIPVSAEFPNATVSAIKNVNNEVTETLDASTELINNVNISTGTDASWSASEMTASAELVEPFFAIQAMTASATMGTNSVSVTPNYFALINQLNPYIYINDGKKTGITNYGSATGTLSSPDILALRDGGFPLNIIANDDSWQGNTALNANSAIYFVASNASGSLSNLIGTGNFAYEFWTKPNFIPTSGSKRYTFLKDSALDIFIDVSYVSGINQYKPFINVAIQNSSGTKVTQRIRVDQTSLSKNNWSHIVVNVYQSGINANERLLQLWVDGQIEINQTIAFTAWTDNSNVENAMIGSEVSSNLDNIPDMFFDEVAIYSEELTNSQIIQHYQFIATASPNYTQFANEFEATAESGSHNVLAVYNVNYQADEATASAQIVNPVVVASRTIDFPADPMTANAENKDVTVYWGWTIYPDPMIVYTEMPAAYHLSSLYSEYVQSNIAPYRYVTFDSANSYLDIGTDDDYSVVPTAIGGTIVNPDLGINGKSALTSGLSYSTGGVILKESEWNDSWGTGQNSYHSAFWFQRAADDQSTTGLRVLWNLNGYKDNQHVVLYQYQGKLHMQFNNGSGQFVQQSTSNIDLFDYQRHFIVIEFDHTNNNNNTVRLYADATLVMTVNLGSYTGTTTNASSADSGPNDEANNHPRLSVGCLITPFASTALPIVPANTKLIIDEVYWDKNSITSSMVVDLYNLMPDKNNTVNMAETMQAFATIAESSVIGTAVVLAEDATASSELVDPSTFIVRVITISANPMTASATMTDALASQNVNIASDVFSANAIFNDAGVVIAIPAPTMYATARLADDIYLTYYDGFDPEYGGEIIYPIKSAVPSPYVSYIVRSSEISRITRYREVK